MAPTPYRFVFLVGASGSGTTMLTRLLSAPNESVGLGGNHISIPRSQRGAYQIARQFKKANDRLWDRRAGATEAQRGGQEMLRLIEQLRRLPEYEQVRRIIFKRSAPFHRGDRYRPDLFDVLDLFDDAKIVAVYRDPRASSASGFRRRFAKTLRACALITAEQLTFLATQLEQLEPQQRLLLSYEALCSSPEAHMRQIADFVGIEPSSLERAITEEGLDPTRNRSWRQKLPTVDVEFLDNYFDERRRRQWRILDELG